MKHDLDSDTIAARVEDEEAKEQSFISRQKIYSLAMISYLVKPR